jgi:hypothetical protein
MGNIRFIQMSNYTSPLVKEVRGKNWVEYGADNNYFQYLIDRYNGSPTNNACVNGISQMIFGRGLDAMDAKDNPDSYAKFLQLIKPDCIEKLVNDFYLLGNGALQVVYNLDHTQILEVEHFPVETLRSGKANENGVVDFYYYFHDWAKIKRNDIPEAIPAFGTSTEGNEILYIKPYKPGYFYYSPVAYQGGVQYAELEEEISNFHLNNVLNGLAPGMLINFNNGVPDEDMQQVIEDDIRRKYQGSSNAGRFILAFNDSKESSATIDAVQLSDAHNQYEFLSSESTQKVMLSHRVVSPMLLGIKDSTGLGNNADELKTASTLMDNIVIRPFQDLIIKNIDRILAFNQISLKLYFKTLQPLEFANLDNAQTEEQVIEETGVNFSLDTDIADELISLGEDAPSNWLLIDEYPVDYDNDDAENELFTKEPKKSLYSRIVELVSTGDARPNIRSKQDEVIDGIKFVTRYVYAGETTSKSRLFCRKMMEAKKIYRKEDIVAMSSKEVNEVRTNEDGERKGFGPRGATTYDVWFYKGGGACHHMWFKRVYAVLSGTALDIPNIRQIAGRKAEQYGYVVKNDKLVSTRPIDMPNKGFLPK